MRTLRLEKHWGNSKIDLVDPHRTKIRQNAPSCSGLSITIEDWFEMHCTWGNFRQICHNLKSEKLFPITQMGTRSNHSIWYMFNPDYSMIKSFPKIFSLKLQKSAANKHVFFKGLNEALMAFTLNDILPFKLETPVPDTSWMYFTSLFHRCRSLCAPCIQSLWCKQKWGYQFQGKFRSQEFTKSLCT